MLYGRDAECRLVDDLIEQGRRGRSDALVLRGDAGIGKSALLRYAGERSGDARLLEIRGVQAETAIPFAGLHALLRPVVDRVQLLSPPQRTALGVALGLEIGHAPSRFLVSAGLVELLAVLAEDQLLVCLVDDAQWVDPQSLAALTFAGRRLRGDRIAMLLAVRSACHGEETEASRLLADLRQLDLTGLDDSAAERLLDERDDLDGSARRAVRAAAQGNPLALLVLRPGQGPHVAATPPVLSEQLQADYLRQTDRLDGRTRTLLLLAAADDTGDLAILLCAASRLGAGDAEVAVAEQRALLRVSPGRVEFAHPLVRSAVYQAAGFAARKEIHLALADAFARIDPSRSTWHRTAVAVPPDEEVAGDLADLARAAVRRAAGDVASRAYEEAARLTGDPQRRLGWLLDAAETAWKSGQVKRASALLTSAREQASSIGGECELGRLAQLRGQLEAVTGSGIRGYEILLEGAETILRVEPERASAMLYAALRTASIAADMDRVARVGRVAARLLDLGSRPAAACFTAGIAELLTGRGEGAVSMLKEGIRTVADSDDPELLYMAASAAAFAGDWSTSRLFASRAVTVCRETGALATLAHALEPLIVAEIDAAPRRAEASADEGLRAARETDQPGSAAVHLAWLDTVAAVRGDRDLTESLAGQVFELDREHGLAYPAALAVRALGLLELGLGRPAEALAHLESVVNAPVHRAAQLVAMDFAMVAAVWAGRLDRAEALLATVGSWAWMQEAAADWAAPTLDRWRALVSDDALAIMLYERSLERQTGPARPFMRGLTHLLLGEQLRRMRHRSAARPHLRTATEIFDRLDAAPWANRARSELRASGETVRRHESEERLTPQELQVAQLVATGASTKAVAAQLYLSPRTVDSHLRQIFTKLGISSRAALRDIDLAG